MKRFSCRCGEQVFFENTECLACGTVLGFDPAARDMLSPADHDGAWVTDGQGRRFQHCRNRLDFHNCNWLVPEGDGDEWCAACRLNRTIPNLDRVGSRQRWAKLEQAKRRLVFGLLALGLPLEAPLVGFPGGLCFDFVEDRRSDPKAEHQLMPTGHSGGVITINLIEADEVQRVWQRESSGERYRTLLGHFRHEAGHYYFELLVHDRWRFTGLFGDPDLPYQQALDNHYADGPLVGWESDHISAYASAHPLEDWAETFAHYLHLRDTLETALLRGVIPPREGDESIDGMLRRWDGLTVTLNELNRSLGLDDAYPFVVTPAVAEKLRFVHTAITECWSG